MRLCDFAQEGASKSRSAAGLDDNEVERYFLEGRIKEIAQYCETDVLNTYQIWLRYELFCGRLTESEHRACERNLADFIEARVNRAPYFPRAPDVQGPEVRVAQVEGSNPAAGTGAATSIDTWVADLLEKPEKNRAASLYELLLRLNLSISHLEDAHETYARRLGLR